MKRRRAESTDPGHPLGLTDAPHTHGPDDQFPPGDHAARKRRTRALGEDGIDRHSTGLGDLNNDLDGAAGIDMGYGGEGTDIKPGR